MEEQLKQTAITIRELIREIIKGLEDHEARLERLEETHDDDINNTIKQALQTAANSI